MWDAWDASTDIGDPPLFGYRVYYMLNNSREEDQEVRRSDRLAPSETVTGLSPDTAYVFGVAAFRPGLGSQGRRLEVVGTTQCSPPSRGPSSVYVTKGTRPGEIWVSWENPPSNTSNCASGFGGIRIYFTRYDIQSGISKRAADPNENSIDIPFDPSMPEYTLTLEPYSQYLIQVVVYNKDSETPRGEGFTQITEEMLAPAPTVSVEATSETVTVRWNAASPAHLNGDVQGYQLRYTRTKPEPLDPVLINVMCNEYVITEGVTGDSEFEIEVRVLNGAGYGEWSPLMTSPLPGDESRYSLRALLVTGLIPSILLICIFCVILIVVFFRRRQPDKGENEKSTHDDSQSPRTAETYQDLYERVSNDGTAYQELELTSVQQGDIDYINIEEGPQGRKNFLKSIENADC
ncbi:neogenin-like [Strongylocentrotus purpuratus]|uniref:Fibronectin type-III domain-containing protein n=1 Tax=Strongylocentrotus purpuratus TaxID=7668 RepID=A0A7M7PL06_STRPU|nr:neogenin-like [Strongylocentrotus purpuratus]